MTRKHIKSSTPTDADLHRNPMIGASKGMTMAQAALEDLEELEGVNTIEGDVENDTNAQGGIDKVKRASGHHHGTDHHPGSGPHPQQGRKTHEQQLRMLERKPDVPDARQEEQQLNHASEASSRAPRHPDARQSEFIVSRAGMNQESQHNKHNHQSQSGHRPQTHKDR